MREFLARWMTPNYSAHGAQLDNINAMVHWLMLVLFVIWGALFVFMLVRFRAKNHPRAVYHGTKSHISTYGEVAVLLVEIVLLVGFSIPAWSRWMAPPPAGSNPLEIRLVAEQFAWNIHYAGPDGKFARTDVKLVTASNPMGIDPTDPNAQDDVSSLNQLHLEVNRPVRLSITSKDVIHSFFLPVMRVKQDAVPGMISPVDFTPVRTDNGEKWEIACAQLCGLGHYRMRGELFVHSTQDFQTWLSTEPPAISTISE